MLYILSILIAIALLTLLVVFASLEGSAMHIVSYSIFGASLVLFYTIRTWLVHTQDLTRKNQLQKLDHIMIYMVIAATYTPVAFLLPNHAWGWTLFGVVWGLVLIASLLRRLETFRPFKTTLGLYVALLILDLVAFAKVHGFLSSLSTLWFTLGGVAYTMETVLVILRPPLPFSKIWKVHENLALPFVIAGSICHFWAFMEILWN
jgi:hemolysin III